MQEKWSQLKYMTKTWTKNLPDLEPKKLWLISFPPMSNNTSVGHCLCSETGRDHGQGRTGLSQEGWVGVPAVRRIVIVAGTLVRMCVWFFCVELCFVWFWGLCPVLCPRVVCPVAPPPPRNLEGQHATCCWNKWRWTCCPNGGNFSMPFWAVLRRNSSSL